MTPDWKEWVGEIAGGEYPLDQFVGAGQNGAVFRTGAFAIKLVPTGTAQAAQLVEQWNRAQALHHPHLLRIIKTGTWKKGATQVAYLVMEHADESLAAVLRDRALSGDETREVLQPVAQALVFLHRQGLAHRALKPSNLLAVNETLKISSDTVAPGDAAVDMRAVAAVMMEALTQNPAISGEAIDRLPPPFAEIARNCAGQSPWSAEELSRRLRSSDAPESSMPVQRKWTQYAVVAGIVLVALLFVGNLLRNRRTETAAVVAQPSTKAIEPAPIAEPPAAKSADPVRPSPRVTHEQGLHQVLPEIPAKARRTIRGHVTVVVKVIMDSTGSVTDATLVRGGSRYFGKLAVAAARKWTFPAGSSGPRLLRFEITRDETKAFVEKSGR